MPAHYPTDRRLRRSIELDDIKPKPMPPRHAAYKGEVARIVLGTLRDAKRACSTQELTMHVMAEPSLLSKLRRSGRRRPVFRPSPEPTGAAVHSDVLIDQVRRLADQLGRPGIVGKRDQTNDKFWLEGKLQITLPSRMLARRYQRSVEAVWGDIAMTRRVRPQ
jgi:hypothetical protein